MKRTWQLVLPILFGWAIFGPIGLFADDHEADNTPVAVSFQSQIWPILQRKCLDCHNSDVTEAGLNLESRTLADSGGHTGNTILGNDPDQSELFQRLISDDEAYRMPKDASPLSQAEIDLFRNWINEGSDWPEVLGAGESSFGGAASRYFDRYINPIREVFTRDSRYLQFLSFPLVAFLLFVVLAERIKKKRRRREAESETTVAREKKKFLDRIGWAHYLAVTMTFVAIGFGMFHFGAVENTNTKIEQLEIEIARLRGERAEGNYGPTMSRPRPPKPRHPKRLGGVYYRGNDERSAKLFNGGFYRTANMEVWLSDSDGNRLKYDDPITDDSLFVSVGIERAPMATSALFTPRVMSAIFLSRQVPDEDAEELKDTPIGFITVEEGERWVAHYPITDSAKSLEDKISGMIYIYQGKISESLFL